MNKNQLIIHFSQSKLLMGLNSAFRELLSLQCEKLVPTVDELH